MPIQRCGASTWCRTRWRIDRHERHPSRRDRRRDLDSMAKRCRAVRGVSTRWCGGHLEGAGCVRREPGSNRGTAWPLAAGFRKPGRASDTACGFAGAIKVGRVLASHYSVNFLSPAIGERFVARAEVIKAGKRQHLRSLPGLHYSQSMPKAGRNWSRPGRPS